MFFLCNCWFYYCSNISGGGVYLIPRAANGLFFVFDFGEFCLFTMSFELVYLSICYAAAIGPKVGYTMVPVILPNMFYYYISWRFLVKVDYAITDLGDLDLNALFLSPFAWLTMSLSE